MSTKHPTEANQESAQPFIPPSGSVDERIARVENGLVVISADWQPQWGNISTLAERITYYHVPGVSIAVIDDYKISFTRGYGERNAGKNEPVTAQTLFHAGSVAKSLSAAAMLALVEQGMLNLDDDVNNYLPFSLRNPNFPDNPITFRMLLSNSPGLNYDSIEYYWLNFSANPPFSFYPYPWVKEYLTPGGKWYKSDTWSSTYRPGEYSMYANVGFDVISYLVELISGENFLDYCNEHIFYPLEMNNTSFSSPGWRRRTRESPRRGVPGPGKLPLPSAPGHRSTARESGC